MSATPNIPALKALPASFCSSFRREVFGHADTSAGQRSSIGR
jgi:hypothetical protein